MTCGTCKHFKAVSPPEGADGRDCYGACNNPSRPWDTPERAQAFGQWSACYHSTEEQPCHEAAVLAQEAK